MTRKHAFDMTPSEYFERSEREAYDYFSAIAARAGVADVSPRSIVGGFDEASVSYNPLRATHDFNNIPGMWDVYLREEVWRVATPRVLASNILPMMVRRSMVVMRVSVLQMPEEIITRPPVFRSETGHDVLLEVAEADVAFGGERELALRNQARYIGWLGALG